MLRSPGDATAVEQLFSSALKLSLGEREGFLQRQCVGRPHVLRDVRSLLRWARKSGSTLDGAAPPMAPPTIPRGSSLGRFQVLEVLGWGGMGAVYLAADESSGRHVALKTVTVARTSLVSAIYREIRTLARLSHPSVASILAHGVSEGLPWYAMELEDGAPLQAPVPLEEALTLVCRLCSALAYLHGEGLVHGDLKPDNILLRPDGEVVIVDFGLVSAFGTHETLEGSVTLAGTTAYMAPEQIRGEALDPRTDLYALGCLLYELLTGKPPFEGASRDVLHQHLNAVPRSPSHVVPGLPPEIDRVVRRLIEKDARHRIGHAQAVAAMLEPLRSGPPLGAAPGGRPYLYRPRFVGRGGPMERLSDCLRRLSEGRGSLVFVKGEAGYGKTRLLIELANRCRKEGVGVVAGDGTGAVGRSPLGGLAVLVRHLCSLTEPGLGRGAEALSVLALMLGRQEPALGRFASGEPAQERPLAEARRDIHEALAIAVRELLGGSPSALVIDDVVSGDDPGLGFLEYLVRGRWLEEMPLLVVGACRLEELSEDARSLLALEGVIEIDVGRLKESDLEAIVEDALADPPPPGLVALLHDLSDGSPLLAMEYLRMAVKEGWLRLDADGRWQMTSALPPLLRPLPRPDAVSAWASRRLELLPEACRRVLQAASICAEEIPHEALSAGDDPADVDEALRVLCREEILAESEAPGCYRFTNRTLRDVVHDSLPPAERRGLHRAAAVRLSQAPEGERLQAELGRHWEHAGDEVAARSCYLGGARAARSAFGMRRAETLYRACLRLHRPGSEEGAEVLEELARTLLGPAGRTAEALAAMEAALDVARGSCDAASVSRRLTEVARLQIARSEYGRARAACLESVALLRERHDPLAECTTLSLLADALQFQGDVDGGERLHRRAVEIAREHLGPGERFGVIKALLNFLQNRGRLEEAGALAEELGQAAAELGDAALAASALSCQGNLLASQGERALAIGRFELAMAHYERMGDGSRHVLLLNMACTWMNEGRFADARGPLERSAEAFRRSARPAYEAMARGNLARVALELGDVDGALAEIDRAIQIASLLAEPRLVGYGLTGRAAICRRLGREAHRSEQDLARAEKAFRDTADRNGLVYVLCERGLLARGRGEPVDSLLREAREIAHALDPGGTAQAWKHIAELESARGPDPATGGRVRSSDAT